MQCCQSWVSSAYESSNTVTRLMDATKLCPVRSTGNTFFLSTKTLSTVVCSYCRENIPSGLFNSDKIVDSAKCSTSSAAIFIFFTAPRCSFVSLNLSRIKPAPYKIKKWYHCSSLVQAEDVKYNRMNITKLAEKKDSATNHNPILITVKNHPQMI